MNFEVKNEHFFRTTQILETFDEPQIKIIIAHLNCGDDIDVINDIKYTWL